MEINLSTPHPQAGDAVNFNYLIKDANVMFLSAGHDHGNDYCYHLQQLSICFGKHYLDGYGPSVITKSLPPPLSTWDSRHANV
jgi:hypothetical protein